MHTESPVERNLSNSFDKLNLPPSPPPEPIEKVSPHVLELIAFLHSRRDGRILPRRDKPWNNVRLSLKQYDEFESSLEKDELLKGWVEDKLW